MSNTCTSHDTDSLYPYQPTGAGGSNELPGAPPNAGVEVAKDKV